jgi:predicted AlkP superfamily phosphohydrolase/phosphomutase
MILRMWSLLKRILPAKLLDRIRGMARGARGRIEEALPERHIDWDRTVAVPWGACGMVRLNVRGRDPRGSVAAEDYEATRARVRDVLEEITDPATGHPVFAEVVDAQGMYEGPYADAGPDLYAVRGDYRYTIATAHDVTHTPLAETEARVVTQWPEEGGIHHPDGILFLHGPAIREGRTIERAGLQDVAPTALYLLDEAIPEDMTGEALTEAVRPGHLEDHPPRFCPAPPQDRPTSAAADYSDEELERARRGLEGMGYL